MPNSTLKTTICSISASRDRARDVLREDVEDDVLPRALAPAAATASASAGGGRLMPVAGAADRDGRPPDEQRERRDDLEIDQRLDAHAADLSQVGMAGDADDERGEQQRRDDGPDQPQEDLAEHAQLGRHRPGSRGRSRRRSPSPRESTSSATAAPTRTRTSAAIASQREAMSTAGGHDGKRRSIEDSEDGGQGQQREGCEEELRHGWRNRLYLLSPRIRLAGGYTVMFLRRRSRGDGCHPTAEVAELADALASGASGRKAIGVRVPASAPLVRPRSAHGSLVAAGATARRVEWCPERAQRVEGP